MNARPEQQRLSRARGALWGQAVGDALGTTVEFQRAEEIASRFPNGVREVVGGGPFDVAPGQVTDDTELALCLARSLAERGRFDEDDVARRYIAWCVANPPDVGGTTRRAFGRVVPAGEPIARTVRARALTDSQANGALMRASPLGLFGWKLEPDALLELTAADTTLSHPHPVCIAASQVFTFAISHALRTGASGPEVFDATLAFARLTPSCGEAVPTLELARNALPADAFHQMGWVRHALQAAFCELRRGDALEAALVRVIGLGGDTDTNGCIAGALLGAVHGVEAIPARWVERVRTCQPARPREFWCNDLDELATTLLGA
ncbi:MAG: ADP-ribosylglycohydrolase family protein [Myxococcaceae bacterium]|nr:ADP-ribosylglycohydrolase family protein [Myxococcaceae bacterium]